MYITPNTNIKIYKNVPLDNKYEDTINFHNIGQQNNYFHGSLTPKYVWTSQTYQRVNRSRIRVQILADNIYDCNYIAFQNSAYGNKWFYAFITSIEWLNNVTSEIEFEIDVMQTYMFDAILEPCFVEREHTISDNLFEHTIPETVDTGGRLVTNDIKYLDLNTMSVAVIGTSRQGARPAIIDYNNVVQGASISAGIPSTDIPSVETMVSGYRSDEIISIYQYPSLFGDVTNRNGYTADFSWTEVLQEIDGYNPRNNKLFIYPYSRLVVNNNQGNTQEYKYEDFNGSPAFKVDGVFVPTVQCTVTPKHHRKFDVDYLFSLSMDNFPTCSIASDKYADYLRENQNVLAMSKVCMAINTIADLQNGMNLINFEATQEDLKVQSQSLIGTMNNDSLRAKNRLYRFDFTKMTIPAEMAIIVDNYFSRYGYRVDTVKTPSRDNRENWTYIKTKNCKIIGGCPADDISKIEEIYNKGITFWNNPFGVGDYLDSSGFMKENRPYS